MWNNYKKLSERARGAEGRKIYLVAALKSSEELKTRKESKNVDAIKMISWKDTGARCKSANANEIVFLQMRDDN